MESFALFATRYDGLEPTGGSIDPLGFLAAYVALADAYLPGFTTVTSEPSYLSVLCMSLWVASQDEKANSRTDRQEKALAIERMWALSLVLAGKDNPSPRGVNYARNRASHLGGSGRITSNFRLLARQKTYGMFGIYGNLAQSAGLIRLRDLQLTDLGVRLGKVFYKSSGAPDFAPIMATPERGMPVDDLREWGNHAYLGGTFEDERPVITEALLGAAQPTPDQAARRVSLPLLRDVGLNHLQPGMADAELRALRAMYDRLVGGWAPQKFPGWSPESGLIRLQAVLLAVLTLEEFYRSLLWLFTRALWLAGHEGAHGTIPVEDVLADEVIHEASDAVVAAAPHVIMPLRGLSVVGIRHPDFQRQCELAERLLHQPNREALLRALIGHHLRVQRSKGKGAWLKDVGRQLEVGPSRYVPDDKHPYETIADVEPHNYRSGIAANYLFSEGDEP